MVVGILDIYGGLRVVITPEEQLGFHALPDEVAFLVPDFQVCEPIEWSAIPYIVARVKQRIAEWIRTRNDPDALEVTPIKLYRLRSLEHPHSRAALNLEHIAET